MSRRSLPLWARPVVPILGASAIFVLIASAVGIFWSGWLDPFSCAVSVEADFAAEDEPARVLWPAPEAGTADLVLSHRGGTHVLRLDGPQVIAEYSTDQDVRSVGPGGGYLFALERNEPNQGYSSNVLTRDGTVVLRNYSGLSPLDEERLIGFHRDGGCGHRGATVVNLSDRSVERIELPELDRGVGAWGRGPNGDLILCEIFEGGSGPECADGFSWPERYWLLDVSDLTVEPFESSALPPTRLGLRETLRPTLETSLPVGLSPAEVMRTTSGLVVDSRIDSAAGANQGPLFLCETDGTDCRELWLPDGYVSIVGLS